MLNRLVDVFLELLELFYVSTIVDEYERALVLRFGVWHRDLAPGFHFHWPLGIESIHRTSVVPDATELGEQVFTLRDGTTIAVKPVLTYRVHNPRKALLEVEDAETSMLDSTSGALRRLMTPHPWPHFVDPESCAEIEAEIAKDIRQEAFRWGFEVLRVTFPTLVELKGSYQVFGVELVA